MFPEQNHRAAIIGPGKQRGLGLVAAIFVITVMALISVGIGNLVVRSQQSYGFEILSARAFLAAESGAQLAVQAALLPADTSGCSASAATPSLGVAAGLGGCQATISCSSVVVASVAYYSISSIGQCGSGNDIAVRNLSLRVKNPL